MGVNCEERRGERPISVISIETCLRCRKLRRRDLVRRRLLICESPNRPGWSSIQLGRCHRSYDLRGDVESNSRPAPSHASRCGRSSSVTSTARSRGYAQALIHIFIPSSSDAVCTERQLVVYALSLRSCYKRAMATRSKSNLLSPLVFVSRPAD